MENNLERALLMECMVHLLALGGLIAKQSEISPKEWGDLLNETRKNFQEDLVDSFKKNKWEE